MKALKNAMLLASLAPMLSVGCGVDSSPPQARAPAPVPVEPSSSIVYPTNWDTIIIARQYDNEKAYGNAHWWIDRTDCGGEEYEPFEEATWNALATAVNTALALKPVPDTALICTDVPDNYDFYQGNVTAEMSDGSTRTLFKLNNNQSCTSIPDAAAASEALRWLNDFVVLANGYGCPKPPVTPPPNPGA